jgi:hypothetical protein
MSWARLGLDQPRHHAHHRARGVELAALLAGGVGELADQVFVSRAQQVGELEVFVAQTVGDRKWRDQLAQPPLLEHVGAAFQEQHPEDVFLELGGIHLAAQDVGGFEQVALQLGQGQRHLWSSSWWRRRESNPRPQALCHWFYMLSPLYCF